MKWIITKNYDEMSKTAMEVLLGYALATPYRTNMAITAGTTPKRLYEMMVPEVKGKNQYKNIHYYNFDEIPYKTGDREGVTMSELRSSFFAPADIPTDRIHVLDEKNYLEQDARLLADGGLDVMLLGIGTDGHYCGNLPGTTHFGDKTSRVDCDQAMKKRISGHFENSEDIPDFYVTMGPRSIMNAKNLILFATGERKADIMKTIWDQKVDESVPASLITLHPSITIIVDEGAASKI